MRCSGQAIIFIICLMDWPITYSPISCLLGHCDISAFTLIFDFISLNTSPLRFDLVLWCERKRLHSTLRATMLLLMLPGYFWRQRRFVYFFANISLMRDSFIYDLWTLARLVIRHIYFCRADISQKYCLRLAYTSTASYLITLHGYRCWHRN